MQAKNTSRFVEDETIPLELIALDKSVAACLSEIFSISICFSEGINPESVHISLEGAIRGNQVLSNCGHLPEVRTLIDRYLNQRDYEALTSLARAYREIRES